MHEKSSLFTESIASMLEKIAAMTSWGRRPRTLIGLRNNYGIIVIFFASWGLTITHCYNCVKLWNVCMFCVKDFLYNPLSMTLLCIRGCRLNHSHNIALLMHAYITSVVEHRVKRIWIKLSVHSSVGNDGAWDCVGGKRGGACLWNQVQVLTTVHSVGVRSKYHTSDSYCL